MFKSISNSTTFLFVVVFGLLFFRVVSADSPEVSNQPLSSRGDSILSTERVVDEFERVTGSDMASLLKPLTCISQSFYTFNPNYTGVSTECKETETSHHFEDILSEKEIPQLRLVDGDLRLGLACFKAVTFHLPESESAYAVLSFRHEESELHPSFPLYAPDLWQVCKTNVMLVDISSSSLWSDSVLTLFLFPSFVPFLSFLIFFSSFFLLLGHGVVWKKLCEHERRSVW